ncbi:MAG: hypothetical protein WBG30_02085 [Psychrilyobacter sp.]
MIKYTKQINKVQKGDEMHEENYINMEKFKKWVLDWDENPKDLFPYLDMSIIKRIKEIIGSVNSIEDFLPNTSIGIFNRYFKYKNASISVGSYYETLIEPSDSKTYKKIIKGFESEIKHIGKIDLYKNGKLIGRINEMTDLWWSIYINDLTNNLKIMMEGGTFVHSVDPQKVLTLKLFDVDENINTDELIEKIIFQCSNELNLNFKAVNIDELNNTEGLNLEFDLEVSEQKLELEPLMYFNSANSNTLKTMKYLSYYQVLEYFYRTVNEEQFKQTIKDSIQTNGEINFDKVMPAVKGFKENLKELDSLKLLLKVENIYEKFKHWISVDNEINDYIVEKNIVNLSNADKFYKTLSKEIYSTRCSIVHSKKNIEGDTFISSESLSLKQILILKQISHWVIKNRVENI